MSVAEVVVCLTTWFRIADALLALEVSPKYTAVSGKRSAFRLDLLRVATPLALIVAVPMECPLQVKFTVPVGGTGPDVVTIAVQVTLCP